MCGGTISLSGGGSMKDTLWNVQQITFRHGDILPCHYFTYWKAKRIILNNPLFLAL